MHSKLLSSLLVCGILNFYLASGANVTASEEMPDVVEAKLECSGSGFNLFGGNCLKELSRKPPFYCLPNSYLEEVSPGTYACLSETSSNPDLTCPTGQTLVNNECKIVEETVPVAFCPKDFVLSNGTCTKSKETPGLKVCPKEFKLTKEKDSCISEVKDRPTYECPVDTVLKKGDLCLKHDVKPLDLVCPFGFTLHDECTKTETLKPEPKCPVGYKYEDNTCVQYAKKPATVSCPVDYEFNGKECVRSTTTTGEYKCEFGFTLQDRKCVKVLEHEPILICPVGYLAKPDAVNSLQCVKNTGVKPMIECPPGSVTVPSLTPPGKACEVRLTIDPSRTCIHPFVWDGTTCVKTHTVPPKEECSTFGYKLVDGSCIKDVISKATPVCAEGCLLRDTFCVRYESATPQIVCQDAETTPQGTCVRIFTTPQQYTCPLEFKLTGTTCIRTALSAPEAQCPTGSRLRGSECILTNSTTAISGCEEGFVLVDNVCVKYERKIPKKLCPKTHRLFNNLCVKKSLGDADFLRSFLS